MLCSLPRRLNIEFPPVMKREISAEGIFRLAAMDFIYVFLSFAVEPRMKIKRNVLAAENRNIVRQFSVDSAAKSYAAYGTFCFYVKAELICMNTRIGSRTADYCDFFIQNFRNRFLQRLLNRHCIALLLKSVVSRPPVRSHYFQIPHS